MELLNHEEVSHAIPCIYNIKKQRIYYVHQQNNFHHVTPIDSVYSQE